MSITPLTMWEAEPSWHFWDSHYLGNGRLGLTVPGGVPLETVTINDDTLWSGSEGFHLNPQHYDAFREAQHLALTGHVKEANNIINTRMEGRWQETYLPLAELHIMCGQADNRRTMPLKQIIEPAPQDITNYRRSLRLDSAVETVSWRRDGCDFAREYVVSHPQDAAFIRLSGLDPSDASRKVVSAAISLSSPLKHESGVDGPQAYLTGIAPDHAEPSYTSVKPGLVYGPEETSSALRFGCCVQVIDTDGQVSTDGQRVYVSDASYAVLAITAGTNYAGFRQVRDNNRANLLARLRSELRACAGACWADLLAEHVQDYQALYGRVDVDLGEPLTAALPTSERLEHASAGVDDPALWALLMQYSRYLTIAASRPGTQAMNLQGIWNDTTMPPWSSNYTTNINVQMNYWPAEVMNLPECHLPLMDMLSELAQAGQRTAQEYYHMPGWVAHHNVDLWRGSEPACEDASWAWWPFGGAWICQHIWTHYQFTGDQAFLRRMFPVLKGAAMFMLDFLTEDEHGYLVTAPSLSPENKYIWHGGNDTVTRLIDEVASGSRCSPNDPDITAVTVASTMDMSILRELFGNLTAAARILGVQDDTANAAADAVKRFPPYKTGKYGQLQEWAMDGEECTPGQGHISHMYPVYPGDLFTQHRNAALYQAARRSLERRQLNAADAGGWPSAWRVCLMARYHDGLTCGQLIRATARHLGAGLLTPGHSQIDAIFGLGAGIGEMLIQSHQGYVEILPTPTVDWCEGHFTGLMARGGFCVSAAWHGGALTRATVTSQLGGECAIKAAGLDAVLDEQGHVLAAARGDKASVMTTPGQRLTLRFKANELANQQYFV